MWKCFDICHFKLIRDGNENMNLSHFRFIRWRNTYQNKHHAFGLCRKKMKPEEKGQQAHSYHVGFVWRNFNEIRWIASTTVLLILCHSGMSINNSYSFNALQLYLYCYGWCRKSARWWIIVCLHNMENDTPLTSFEIGLKVKQKGFHYKYKR